jgi:hypothetical protein
MWSSNPSRNWMSKTTTTMMMMHRSFQPADQGLTQLKCEHVSTLDLTQFATTYQTTSVEECPNGYSRLAAFNASEQNFMLYRGFSNVHARLLLNLQASIQKLEAELDGIDRFHDTLPEADKKRLRSWDLDVAACRAEKEEANEEEEEDEVQTRQDIMEQLRIKVNQYDELLIKARELVSFQRPTEHCAARR